MIAQNRREAGEQLLEGFGVGVGMRLPIRKIGAETKAWRGDVRQRPWRGCRIP
jgi:hypothetical protein